MTSNISTFRQEIVDAVLEHVAAGKFTGDACKLAGVHYETFKKWRAQRPELRSSWVDAFLARCAGFAEEAVQILDDIPPDPTMPQVAAARAQSDIRRFFAARAVAQFQERAALFGEGAITIVQLPDNGRGRLLEGHAEDVTDSATDISSAVTGGNKDTESTD